MPNFRSRRLLVGISSTQGAKDQNVGWVTAGFDFSTSNKSNIPESYAIVPNNLELDQAVVRIVTSSLQKKIGNAV
jgi:hypothetical protein